MNNFYVLLIGFIEEKSIMYVFESRLISPFWGMFVSKPSP